MKEARNDSAFASAVAPGGARGWRRAHPQLFAFALRRVLAQDAPKPQPLPGDLKKAPFLDSWIRVGADGKITIFTGKSELGQGIKTALRQIAAEELSVKFEDTDLITSDTAQTADEGFTSGSQSMSDSGTAILHAAAQVRELLIALAATKLGVEATTLKAEGGKIVRKVANRSAMANWLPATYCTFRRNRNRNAKIRIPFLSLVSRSRAWIFQQKCPVARLMFRTCA